jgi:hypothetical protein
MARYIFIETLISIVINAVISAGFALFVFGGRTEIPLWGASGIAFDFVPQTFMIALMSVIVPTALTRKRIRAGALSQESHQSAPLPRNLFARALLIAFLATIVLGGMAIVLTICLWGGPADFKMVLPIKILYGAMVALVVTPLALRAALADKHEKKDSR